jgi:hypothetical protein
MAVIGLLLLVVVVLVAIAALFRGSDSVRIDLEWFSVRTDASVIFFAGVVATLLFVLGCWLVLGGLKRSRRRRSEMRALRDRAEASEKARPAEAAGHRSSSSTTGGPASGTTASHETREMPAGPDAHFDSAPRDP